MKITLALAVLALSALPTAASAEWRSYDHSMQALGSSERGMPPVERHPDRRHACAPLGFDETLPPCG